MAFDYYIYGLQAKPEFLKFFPPISHILCLYSWCVKLWGTMKEKITDLNRGLRHNVYNMIVVKKHFYLNIIFVALVSLAYLCQTCMGPRNLNCLVISFIHSAWVVHFCSVLNNKYQYKLLELSEYYSLNVYLRKWVLELNFWAKRFYDFHF